MPAWFSRKWKAMPEVYIASDHAGLSLKKYLISKMDELRVNYRDVGCFDESSCDYSDFARKVCEAVVRGEVTRGILICGTGIGMSMAANRFPGVRAAVCCNEFQARMSRAHNDSNVLCVGSRVTGSEAAFWIMKVWLEEPFEGGRHKRRIDKMDQPI